MRQAPEERFPFRMNLRLPLIGAAIFAVLTGLMLFGATRPGADPNGVPAILGLGAVLMLFPLMLVIVQLRNRGKVVVVGQQALEVPNRLTAGVAKIPWANLTKVEQREIRRGAATVGRALWLHHPGGSEQILESDLGSASFTRIGELLASRQR